VIADFSKMAASPGRGIDVIVDRLKSSHDIETSSHPFYMYIYIHIYIHVYTSLRILIFSAVSRGRCENARKKFERTVGPRWRRIRKEKLSFLRTIMQRSNGKTKNASAYMLKYNNSEVPSSIKCQWEVSKILEYQGFMPQESKKVCRNLGI